MPAGGERSTISIPENFQRSSAVTILEGRVQIKPIKIRIYALVELNGEPNEKN